MPALRASPSVQTESVAKPNRLLGYLESRLPTSPTRSAIVRLSPHASSETSPLPAFCAWRLAFAVPHSALRTPHLAFGVWRLALGLRRSAFRIPRSAFRIPHSAFRIWRLAFPPVLSCESGTARLTASRVTVNILSIQSSVAYGHVGNSAAVFPLQRIGVEVWPVNTVQFSNHTGYGKWRGAVVPVEVVRDVVQGIEERGILPVCDGVLSGYLGDAALGEVILDAYSRIKRVNAKATYCLDPVMGDVGRGFFVRPGIPEFMRDKALPAATLITPNQFELEFLSGLPVRDFPTSLRAAKALQERGPSIVLVTSLCREDGLSDEIEVLAVDPGSAYVVATPKLPIVVNGAGDTTAALFYAHWLRTQSIRSALELTVNAIFAVLEKTVEDAAGEIQLIAAQDAIANPPKRFVAREI